MHKKNRPSQKRNQTQKITVKPTGDFLEDLEFLITAYVGWLIKYSSKNEKSFTEIFDCQIPLAEHILLVLLTEEPRAVAIQKTIGPRLASLPPTDLEELRQRLFKELKPLRDVLDAQGLPTSIKISYLRAASRLENYIEPLPVFCTFRLLNLHPMPFDMQKCVSPNRGL